MSEFELLKLKKCLQECHDIKELQEDKRKHMRITQEIVLEAVLEVYRRKGRPVHIGDLKEFFDIREKRDSIRAGNWSRIDSIEHAMRKLFKRGLLSRSERMVRVENYKTSPFAFRKKTTANVYFYAPIELAGRIVEFEIDGQYFAVKLVKYEDFKEKTKARTKKDMVLEVLKSSEKAMTVDEILEEINRRYNAYEITSKKDFYNATSSLLRAVLKPLRKEGLRGIKVDGKWVWYFTEEQLENFKEEYIRKSELLRTARDLVKSEKCVPLSRVLSEIAVTVDEAKYHLKRVAKCIGVEIEVHTSGSSTEVNVKVPDFKRDSFIDWLGYVVPKSPYGYGYESFLVDLDSDWEEKLKKEIAKSLARINIKAVIGSFYEKLVARLFEIICSAVENPKLSKFSIPFVFRDKKVTNVWIVTEKGRKIEFDVLIRGTFYPFNVMVDGKSSLDIIMPIECKYTLVKPEHVANFDDRIKAAFGNARNIMPIMIGLGWSNEALHMAKRLGIMTLYFSAIDRLISEMTGKKYRHENEWRRVEEMLNRGEITLRELRDKLKKGEWRFEFERLLKVM